ncbi:hypothetical protein [Streptohalobacillus salinus]|uniref:hypothetical protein n=1 Tax=Streptohalobacillus salinus TaxID=621096 RepID=UPI0011B24B1A|nr:hypothetical protein [Streptohalobacillus salinus]
MGGGVVCIYCDSKDLTDSDIIPYAITEAKLIKRFVCSKHNSHTNNEFEKKVIKKLDVFRKNMGLKTRDGNEIKIKIKMVLDEDEFDIVYSDYSFLHEKQQFFKDGKIIFQPGTKKPVKGLNELYKFYPKYKDIVPGFITRHNPFELFGSEEMFRTISKIAYEWHCYKNNIDSCHDRYKEIIDYIVDGKERSKCKVELVDDAFIYNAIGDVMLEVGTNAIYEYVDNNGQCVVVFFLWNVIAYKVIIGTGFQPTVSFSFLNDIELYNIDGSRVENTFGVYSLENTYQVNSIEFTAGYKRIGKAIESRLNKALGTLILSPKNLRKLMKQFSKDFTAYKSQHKNLLQLIEYGCKNRIVLIWILILLGENEDSFNSGENFNSNLFRIIGEETISVNEEKFHAYLDKIGKLAEENELISKIDKGMSIVDISVI